MFTAPINDIGFCLQAVSGLVGLQRDGLAPEADEASVAAILTEAGRAAESLIAPLDRAADRIGARHVDGRVVMPPGFRDAYQAWRAGGWIGADAPAAIGGSGLPLCLGAAFTELWHSGSMGLAMGFVLTQAAAELLADAGSPELVARYLPRLVSGEWTATMAMTEPQAGSDLGLTRTRATACDDGSYRLWGDKQFISFGDHDLTDNIVHMVIARVDGDPAGTRGLSLFLVSKVLPDGTANAVACPGIERKMGLHGSPTCHIRFGNETSGATGWLVGERTRGLWAMFTMMNRARLSTGMQGTAVGEVATQQAYRYARERFQGAGADGETASIAAHPDVARMLLDMRSATAATRALSFFTAATLDRARRDPDPARAAAAAARGALLTPMVKAYGSDMGVQTASLAVQVHGGSGYVEDTGIAQRLRDIRIAPIYEGTNGIQAIDLVLRRILPAPETLEALLAEMDVIAGEATDPMLADAGSAVTASVASVREAAAWLAATNSRDDRLWGATPMLTLLAQTIAGALLLRAASAPDTACFRRPADMAVLARVFAQNRLSHSAALAAQVCAGAMNAPEALSAYA